MRRLILILGLVFVVTLAVVVGNRMSADAMAVVVGVTCGVLASIPTSLLVMWASGRRIDPGACREGRVCDAGLGSQYPPVVVVNSGEGYSRPSPGVFPYGMEQGGLLSASPRDFKVVGDPDSASDWGHPKRSSWT